MIWNDTIYRNSGIDNSHVLKLWNFSSWINPSTEKQYWINIWAQTTEWQEKFLKFQITILKPTFHNSRKTVLEHGCQYLYFLNQIRVMFLQLSKKRFTRFFWSIGSTKYNEKYAPYWGPKNSCIDKSLIRTCI